MNLYTLLRRNKLKRRRHNICYVTCDLYMLEVGSVIFMAEVLTCPLSFLCCLRHKTFYVYCVITLYYLSIEHPLFLSQYTFAFYPPIRVLPSHPRFTLSSAFYPHIRVLPSHPHFTILHVFYYRIRPSENRIHVLP